MKLHFWKYEGAGNDFIVVDGRHSYSDLTQHGIRRLCDRHMGIGADGLILLSAGPGYDFRMNYYNSDGGEANIGGSEIRCATLFAEHLGIGQKDKIFIGPDGTHTAKIITSDIDAAIIEMDMIDVGSFEYSDGAFFLNTGVPHYIEFTNDVTLVDILGRGMEIRFADRFDNYGGTNVNFVEIQGHGRIKIRTYERGVENETMSCSTGATACAIATRLYAQGDCDDYTVHTEGGDLYVRFKTTDNQNFTDIKLTGPARRVFEGTAMLYPGDTK